MSFSWYKGLIISFNDVPTYYFSDTFLNNVATIVIGIMVVLVVVLVVIAVVKALQPAPRAPEQPLYTIRLVPADEPAPPQIAPPEKLNPVAAALRDVFGDNARK